MAKNSFVAVLFRTIFGRSSFKSAINCTHAPNSICFLMSENDIWWKKNANAFSDRFLRLLSWEWQKFSHFVISFSSWNACVCLGRCSNEWHHCDSLGNEKLRFACETKSFIWFDVSLVVVLACAMTAENYFVLKINCRLGAVVSLIRHVSREMQSKRLPLVTSSTNFPDNERLQFHFVVDNRWGDRTTQTHTHTCVVEIIWCRLLLHIQSHFHLSVFAWKATKKWKRIRK